MSSNPRKPRRSGPEWQHSQPQWRQPRCAVYRISRSQLNQRRWRRSEFRRIHLPRERSNQLNTYIFKLDYKMSADGNHSLFIRGNLQNDHESKPPQFPGLPPNDFLTNNSKGVAGGYTWIIRPNLINNFRYAYIRQGVGDSGINNQPFNRLRGLDDVVGLTPSILTNVPVNNIIDDMSQFAMCLRTWPACWLNFPCDTPRRGRAAQHLPRPGLFRYRCWLV